MAELPNPLDPKYALGAEQARQNVMIGVSVTMTLIGVSCVALRVYTRGFIVRNIGSEDWTMIGAALLTIVYLLELIAGAKEFNLGFSGMSMTPEQVTSNLKLVLAIVIVYKMIMTLIKISILLIYLRLAVNNKFERLCKGTLILLVAYQFIVIVVTSAQCTPLQKLWDFTGSVPGYCINTNAFYYVTSAFHIIMDIWILVLPLRLIMRIPRQPRDKLALYIIFGLGAISTLASIIRLHFLRMFTLSNDPIYDSLPINTWSMVEVNIGILCASIPTLKPLVSKAQRNRTNSALARYASKRAGGGAWPKDDKAAILKTGGKLMISLHPATTKGRDTKIYDEEWDLDDRPPPVPPKDDVFDDRYNPAPRKPDLVHAKSRAVKN
ncbi:integral membrane protein [Stemphylium lycopersici]|nr:integral membrane protein [Stemphylium lycopersici]RAR08998.1 integral membrane protein [Stemphylium lycopersici]